MNHGGKRAGAGRPALKRRKIRLSVRIKPEIHDKLQEEDDKAKVVNEVLEKHYKEI